MPHLLIVEDEPKLRRNLVQALEREGYRVTATGDGVEGERLALELRPDAIVLDLSLPGRDGLDILATCRTAGLTMPVLLLTARDAVACRVAGLDAGADDYLVKPFVHAELTARLRALLRRGGALAERILRCDDLQLDVLTRRVVRGGTVLELSQREFELLEYLLRRKNEPVGREQLNRDVWREPPGVLTNAIDVCIKGLRRKVEGGGFRPLILTVRGVGYVVRDPE